MKWRLSLTPNVQQTVRVLPPTVKHPIRASLEELCKNPWLGKALRDELAGLYSYRVRRFRVIYRLERHKITIVVVGVGQRETVYEELATGLRLKD